MSTPHATRRLTAIQLLDDNLASLPHKELGNINLLPFAHDSEQVRTIKRQVCEAIIDLLDGHGFFAHDTADQPDIHALEVQCIDCANSLFTATVDSDGLAKTKAANFIGMIGGINPDCASGHTQITVDDVRAHIEREYYADPDTRRSLDCPTCQAQPGQPCRKVKGHQMHNGLHDERGLQS